MKKLSNTFKIIWISLSLIASFASLGGCVKNMQLVGYTMEGQSLDKLIKGKTRKAVVKRELGSPSTITSYGNEVWYYISTEYERVAFFKPKIKSQSVLAIEFNKNQTIRSIKQYTAADAKKLKLTGDTTKTEGHDAGVIGQMLGNVGRFNK